MATLFVDCDDTLVTWMPTHSIRGDRAWQPNWTVVAAMERWQKQGGDVVVWSEKGIDYASTWARRAAPQLTLTSARKDVAKPGFADVAIDDLPLSTKCVCYRPTESMLVAPAPLN